MSIKLCSVMYLSTQLCGGKQHELNGISFISHLAHVASILEEFGQSKNAITASFLRNLNLYLIYLKIEYAISLNFTSIS